MERSGCSRWPECARRRRSLTLRELDGPRDARPLSSRVLVPLSDIGRAVLGRKLEYPSCWGASCPPTRGERSRALWSWRKGPRPARRDLARVTNSCGPLGCLTKLSGDRGPAPGQLRGGAGRVRPPVPTARALLVLGLDGLHERPGSPRAPARVRGVSGTPTKAASPGAKITAYRLEGKVLRLIVRPGRAYGQGSIVRARRAPI
jgi:hypothetical protein